MTRATDRSGYSLEWKDGEACFKDPDGVTFEIDVESLENLMKMKMLDDRVNSHKRERRNP